MKYSKLHDDQIRKIFEEFIEIDGFPSSSKTARLLKVNRHTVDRFYNLFRKQIDSHQDQLLQEMVKNTLVIKDFRSTPLKESKGKIYLLFIYKKLFTCIRYDNIKPSLSPIRKERLTSWIPFTNKERMFNEYEVLYFSFPVNRDDMKSLILEFFKFLELKRFSYYGVSKKKHSVLLKETEFLFNNRGNEPGNLANRILDPILKSSKPGSS